MVVTRPPMWRQMSSMERFWAERIQCLILAKVCSIGLRSGEYGGRYQSLAPAALIKLRRAADLWLPRLMGWTPPGGICVPEWVVLQTTKEASMEQIITVGLDLAKHVFQVHGAGVNGAVVLRKKLRREQLLGFFAKLPRCTVAMEACGGAHHWAREIARLGHEVKLIAPAYV